MDRDQSFEQLLLDLLPSGLAWDKGPGSMLAEAAAKVGNVFYVFDFSLKRFPDQLSPKTCFKENLSRYQKDLGIAPGSTDLKRQETLNAWVGDANLSMENLLRELKAAFGVAPIVREFLPSRSGQSRCGQPLRGLSYLSVISIEAVPINDNSKSIIKRYLQAHIACFLINPDKNLERLQ